MAGHLFLQFAALFLLSEQVNAEFLEVIGRNYILGLRLEKNSKELFGDKRKQIPSRKHIPLLDMRFTTHFIIRFAETIPTKCEEKRRSYIEKQFRKLGNALRGASCMRGLYVRIDEIRSLTSLDGIPTLAKKITIGEKELEKSEKLCNAMVAHLDSPPKLSSLRVRIWSNDNWSCSHCWEYILKNDKWTAYEKFLLNDDYEWVEQEEPSSVG